MKEVGMEDCTPNLDDDTTDTTLTSPTTMSNSASMTSTTTSSGFLDSSPTEESSSTSAEDFDSDLFPIMQLPTEIRSRILNLLPQRQVPTLRLVCHKWREEIDQFYEFTLNIYDTNTNLTGIRRLRCRECTIWKLTTKLDDSSSSGGPPRPLFAHPAYLKVIKVYGPMSAENLSNLISASTNLEHLTLTRRANYPWNLNLADTPGLAGLEQLRYLRLNSEERVSIHSLNPGSRRGDHNSNPAAASSKLPPPPMMDCYFPKLKHFEILKRFAVWQYSAYVTSILKFVARHSKTLRNIELDLIPLSCIAVINGGDDSSSSSSDDDDSDNENNIAHNKNPQRRTSAIPSDQIQLPDLCNLKLAKFCVTTKGADCDIFIWSSILENQKTLTELRFDWLCRDPRAEMRARVTGFPWIHFQTPVERCASTLVHVELASLSMFYPAGGGGLPKRVLPFDLAIFRNCNRLKSLILRCRENHAKLEPVVVPPPNNDVVDEEEIDMDFAHEDEEKMERPLPPPPVAAAVSSEVLLMINGGDLPTGLEQLEIFRFPMLTSDIQAMISSRLPNIRKLFLHECGKTGNFGVDAGILIEMGNLTRLKFLEVIGFNDRGGEKRTELEGVFQTIGLPYEGQDTWLEFSDGSSSAHESLKVLVSQHQNQDKLTYHELK